MQEWRFIDSGSNDGPFNMAADEYLTYSSGYRPILRVYAWQPVTISIGHHQNFSEINLDKCRENGVDIVRRPTGGRAIFHAHEVTYSVIFSKKTSLFQENSVSIYNLISQALVKGLNMLGSSVTLERLENGFRNKSGNSQKFACFASSAKYEIHYQSRKLVGSAQRRFQNALLQHGSILLGNKHLDLVNYLSSLNGSLSDFKKLLARKTVSLESILGRPVAYKEVVDCLKSGFESAFDVKLQPEPFTDHDHNQINKLKETYCELRRARCASTY